MMPVSALSENKWLVGLRLTEGLWSEVWLATEKKQQVPKDSKEAEEFKDEPLRSSMTTQRFFSQSLGSSQGAGGEKWEEWASIYRGGAQQLLGLKKSHLADHPRP